MIGDIAISSLGSYPPKPGSAKVNENAFHVMLLSRTSHMRLNISLQLDKTK